MAGNNKESKETDYDEDQLEEELEEETEDMTTINQFF
jgi:hypothetical protein